MPSPSSVKRKNGLRSTNYSPIALAWAFRLKWATARPSLGLPAEMGAARPSLGRWPGLAWAVLAPIKGGSRSW